MLFQCFLGTNLAKHSSSKSLAKVISQQVHMAWPQWKTVDTAHGCLKPVRMASGFSHTHLCWSSFRLLKAYLFILNYWHIYTTQPLL